MYSLKSAQRLARAVRVEWEDGLAANFTYVWLRDNSTNKRPSLVHLDLYDKPQELDYSTGKLSVVWPPFFKSHYSSRFLRDHAKVKPIQKYSKATHRVLKTPWKLLEMPSRKDSSHMAEIYWSDRCIEPATVWPHFEVPPSLVAVEALGKDSKVSVVDAIEALAVMSSTHPKEFQFLVSNPIEYQHEFFKASHKVATIEDNIVTSAIFNNELRSAEITTDSLDEFYTCMKTFNRICCDMTKTIILQPGQLLIVDNAQTLLGAPAQSGRWLKVRIYQ